MKKIRIQEQASTLASPDVSTRTNPDTGDYELVNVTLLGPVSLNRKENGDGRRYLPQALEAAARLFEGVKVYLDHAKIEELPDGTVKVAPHKVEEYVGRIFGTKVVDGRVRGDRLVVYNKLHIPLISSIASSDPTGIGLSPDFNTVRDDNDDVVDVLEAFSVDLVAEPATTHGLYEHRSTEEKIMPDPAPSGNTPPPSGNTPPPSEPPKTLDSIPWDQATAEDLKKNRPDIVGALLREHADALNEMAGKLTELASGMAPAGKDTSSADGRADNTNAGGGSSGTNPPTGSAPSKESVQRKRLEAENRVLRISTSRRVALSQEGLRAMTLLASEPDVTDAQITKAIEEVAPTEPALNGRRKAGELSLEELTLS